MSVSSCLKNPARCLFVYRRAFGIMVSLLLFVAYPCHTRADDNSSSDIVEVNESVIQEVWDILQLLEQESAPEQEEIVQKLTDLGSDAVPTLFGMLVWTFGYGIETKIGQYLNENRPYDDNTVPPGLLVQHEQVLFETLIRMRDDGLDSYLQTIASSKVPLGFRITASRIVKIIAMDDQGIIRDMLGKNPLMDVILITHIKEIADAFPKGLKRGTLDKLRRFLDHKDWTLRRASAKAMGELWDVESIPRLIELLEDENKGVRDNALRSLKRMSGLRFHADRSRWSKWFEREDAWLQNESPQLVGKLGSKDNVEVFGAIRSISRKRLFRDEMSEELATILLHRTPEIKRAGCIALQQLGSTRATEPLVDALEDPDIGVRKAAWSALTSITHQDLPIDYKIWKAWLENKP